MEIEQAAYQIRFDWGRDALTTVACDADVIAWVDTIVDDDAAPVGGPDSAAIVAVDIVTACAAAGWVASHQQRLGRRLTIVVLAAGRVGPNHYAVEDHLAAGAFIACLGDLGIDATSPEAAVAEAAFRGLEGAVGHLVSACVTGRAVGVSPSAFRVDRDLDASAARIIRARPCPPLLA